MHTPRRPGSPTKVPRPPPFSDFFPETPSTAPRTAPQPQNKLRRPMSLATLPSASVPLSASRLGLVSPSSPSLANPVQYFKGTVHVSVRAKPEPDWAPHWSVDAATNTLAHASAGNFVLDEVYDPSATNASVFERSVASLVEQVAKGFNATVFAYGNTGSGKTYSMQGSPEDSGVIPRSVNLLFSKLEEDSTVKVSYLEIYNERVCDLLLTPDTEVPVPVPGEVVLRDDPVCGVKTVGLSEIKVATAEELLQHIATGDQVRKTSSTEYNLHSSRSHAVVQIKVLTSKTESMLYLCDLAGSERAATQSERRKEGSYINKSLLTLGTVISRLSAGGSGHVPYRNSKLTRLLQPSLSGKALVSVLCMVQLSPGTVTQTETLNTLRFAARAKDIVVVAKRNSILDDGTTGPGSERQQQIIEQQRAEIAQLRSELAQVTREKEDVQAQFDFYLANGNDNSGNDPDESIESILVEDSATAEEYRRKALQDKAEIARLNEQVSMLITQISETNDALAEIHEADKAANTTPPTPRSSSRSSKNSACWQDFNEDIAELRETIKDKDHIIRYLRTSNERRSHLTKIQQGV